MRGGAALLGALAAWSVVAAAAPGMVEGDVGAVPHPKVLPIPPLPPGPPPTSAIPADVLAKAIAVADRPLPERIDAISAMFLGKPYTLDGLGEGDGTDPDPRARYDAFDCLGLVEEVVSLALAGDPSHSAEVRNRMRWGAGPIDYAHRRHFMELQWLPGNVADGFIEDTTTRYGRTNQIERTVTAATWATWRKRERFVLADDQLPVGTISLDVLPLDEAARVASTLPTGAIVLTVRQDRNTPIWITHTGFVVHAADGTAMLRDASRRSAMAVIDEDLVKYVHHLTTYANWPVAGLAIFEPIEQLPRRSAAR